nr:ABC-three component system protein [Amylibacter sp.]
MTNLPPLETTEYPATAAPTWSGFVYQGKIALYHCLKLIEGGDEQFELQLDSSDDFAIYKDGVLVSAHQVKAKISKYRSGYTGALNKCAKIEHDRIKNTSRYLHVSVKLNDTSDHTEGNGELVKFYDYEGKKHCGLGEIEGLIKGGLKKICAKREIVLSDNLLNYNYCLLSEKISSTALEVHRLVQDDRDAANKAAYEKRIKASELIDDILDQNPHDDKVYYAADLRSKLYDHLETGLDHALPNMNDRAYARARNLFEHIRDEEINTLEMLCQLMKPSVRFSTIQRADIRRYSKLIGDMSIDPILTGIPHYKRFNQNDFYLPTALDLPWQDDREGCISDLQSELEANDELGGLLFEYNNLIACRSTETFTIDTKYTHSYDRADSADAAVIDSNITKALCLTIVTKNDAEADLNDK